MQHANLGHTDRCRKGANGDRADIRYRDELVLAHGVVRWGWGVTKRSMLRSAFAARDPAHARLVAALAVTSGMLLSALFGQFIIRTFHVEGGLLAMSIFLSVQAGSMVKDATARGRVLTTALLIPALIAAIATAALLSVYRPLVIAGFVVIAGAAIWVRRFGPRAAALGSLSFMGYFFTLFMKPTPAELPAFALIAAGAVAAQLLMRAVLLIRRPRRELVVLLRELRAASSAAVHVSAAVRTAREGSKPARMLRAALARLDDVGQAATTWQHQFQTDRQVFIDEQTLAEQLLDARVDIEEACYERARNGNRTSPASSESSVDEYRSQAEVALFAVLDERTTPPRVHAARHVAAELLRGAGAPTVDVEAYLLARGTISHAKLRDLDFGHGRDEQHARPQASTPSAASARIPGAPVPALVTGPLAVRGRQRWRSWAPTSRMAVQVMIAATVAAGVGEAISASRWYWAVMTAFVIFIGATTRSSIFTRAYRRVAGTGIGIAAGVGAVALAGENTDVLVGVCVVAVFGMLYLGPLNYLYSSVFITAMLVALYRMLGVLDGSILELRLIETISGAVIGVLCAYLILSTNSRGVLLEKVDAYFDALDRLLAQVRTTPRVTRAELMASLQRMESARSNLDQAVSSMSAALIVGDLGGVKSQADAVHLMYVATRAAARLTQAQSRRELDRLSAGRVDGAIEDVSRAASVARSVLHGTRSTMCASTRALEASQRAQNRVRPPIVDALRDLPADDVAARDAVLALSRIDWALGQIVNGTPPRRPRRRGLDKKGLDAVHSKA